MRRNVTSLFPNVRNAGSQSCLLGCHTHILMILLSDAIVPVNSKRELNVAENISNIEEGAPAIISIPAEGGNEQQPPQLAANGQVEDPSSTIPFIGFDNDNIHTSYAVTTFGAFA